MRQLISALFILAGISLNAQSINIIPQPVSLKQPRIAAKFTLSASTVIELEGSNLEGTAGLFNDYLQSVYNFRLKIVGTSSNSKNAIRFNFERMDNPIEGAYKMTVDNNGIYIAGDNEPGVFYGMQTLIQLLPVTVSSKLAIPYCSIEDYPRFSYRGMHLDVCRHFFPVSFVKKYIDYLALHKMNYFHWHLTEDQGWRIEIKKYPKLTSVGAYRNGTIIGRYPGTGNDSLHYGGFYTQEEIKDIVKYASARYITIVPEIEMPGHSSAAIAAYPELSCFPNESTKHPAQCAWAGDTTGKQVQQTWGVFDDIYCAGKESTFTFLEDVIDEIIPLFPSQYIHVGGDESPKANWKRCPLCQQRIKENNLKDEHELQSYFIQRIEKYINSKGRTLIGWDEILEGGLAPNAVVMSWRGESGGIEAAKQKHTVIMSPQNPVYFDHTQSRKEDSVTIGGYNPLDKVYAYEPVPKEMNTDDTKYVLGAQANVWTEYMGNERKAEYMIFPRMSALSEVLWSPKAKRNWADFQSRLQTQIKRYELWKANYSKASFDLTATVIPSADRNGVVWQLVKKGSGGLIMVGNNQNPRVINASSYNFKITDSSANGPYIAAWVERNKQPLNPPGIGYDPFAYPFITTPVYQQFYFNKATGKKITLTIPPADKYPGDGAFTLVNGVQNTQKLSRSSEFLGFEGTDCESIIDLGKVNSLTMLTAHILDQKASWIWPPSSIVISVSVDGKKYTTVNSNSQLTDNKMICTFDKQVKARFVKVLIRNHGIIEEGNTGAGNKAWLFVDEIELN